MKSGISGMLTLRNEFFSKSMNVSNTGDASHFRRTTNLRTMVSENESRKQEEESQLSSIQLLDNKLGLTESG